MKEADLQVGRNEFGLPVIAYDFGNGLSYLSIVRDEKEAKVRIAVDELLKIADAAKEDFKLNNNKITEATELFAKFEEALEFDGNGITRVVTDSENLSE
jgi:predicted RNA methylase